MYIIEFEDIGKEIIWGGKKLASTYKKDFDKFKYIAESWNISPIKGSESIVKNGVFKGKTINELSVENIFGLKSKGYFPIFIKMIDANKKLSIQVHPNEEYAMKTHNEHGKNEMWYIMDAELDAKLLIGLKSDISVEMLKNALENDEHIEDMFQYENIKKGDVFYIPSGCIHAIMGGALIAEIQTPSNVTYRIYDWNRVGDNGEKRELHLEDAFNVIKPFGVNDTKINKTYKSYDNYKISHIIDNEFFCVDEIILNEGSEYSSSTNAEYFEIIFILDGMGNILATNKIDIYAGKTLLIPSSLGSFNVCADSELTFLMIKRLRY